jgi:hypothetical protein
MHIPGLEFNCAFYGSYDPGNYVGSADAYYLNALGREPCSTAYGNAYWKNPSNAYENAAGNSAGSTA